MAAGMVVSVCKHCQEIIYGGVTKGVWADASPGSIQRKVFCKDSQARMTEQQHEPHIWYTEGGGEAVYDNRYGRYIFIQAPNKSYNLAVGEFVPEDWALQ